MKFSEHWLRTFVDPALTTRELADVLTMSGLEVEAVESAAPPFYGVVVAKVLAVEPHPSAERLKVCRVDAGGAPVQIVCGAPSVTDGMRVPLAQVDARLGGGAQIAAAQVRGIESHGMLCSAADLGISDDASGLLVLAADAPVGTDLRSYLDLDDQLLTIKLTPNRGDCLSVFGIAREVAAVTGAMLEPVAIVPVPPQVTDTIEIALEAGAACPRYCGRIVRGVDAGAPTPGWMVQRLERSGIRSISAIVDVTNYVMLELGQPLHAFDRARIDGGIRVRFGREGEKLKLLNEQEIALKPDLLVIADRAKPLALAGIMGGLESAVSEATVDILLESAFFEPAVIAGKSRLLGFGSDSSYRFERGVDFEATQRAIERATRLVIDICGGQAGPVCEAKGALPERAPVLLRRARAERLLGISLSAGQIEDVLQGLGFDFETRGDDEFVVVPPSYRFDIAIEEDLIEEVARIRGYDNIPAAKPVAAAGMLPETERRVSTRRLRTLLVDRGYQEIVSYSFVDRRWEADFCRNEDPVALINPIAAHLNVMRSSLVGSLVDCLKLNLSRQQERARLFEIGRCFFKAGDGYSQAMMVGGIAYGEAAPSQWGTAARRVDFYDVKADVEAMLAPNVARFEAVSDPAFHPGRAARLTLQGVPIGRVGELHPHLRQKYDLPFAPIAFELNLESLTSRDLSAYSEFPRQPQVKRDLAVEINENITAQAMLDAMKKRAPGIVADIALFDVYRGKGIDSDKKSIAFRILLQDTLKTLTDAEAEAAIQRLLQVLQEEFQAKLRK